MGFRPSGYNPAGVSISTGLSDSANLARLNAANVFTADQSITNGGTLTLSVSGTNASMGSLNGSANFHLKSGGYIALSPFSSADRISIYDSGAETTELIQFPGTGGIQLSAERAAPSAPSAGAILYVDSTTHNLMARFSTGSPVIIGAHP